jgi:hypothetical protein
VSTSKPHNHVDYVTAYDNGWKDGQRALRKHMRETSHEYLHARDVLNSLECTIAWLENGNDVDQAVEELRLQVARLKPRVM